MKRNFFVFLLFTFLGLTIFWQVFLGKVDLNGNLLVSFYAPFGENLPYKNSGWDHLRIFFPAYHVTFEQFKNFEIPLWNPYYFIGNPHAANFQSAVFYPLNFFGFFLPQIEFWHLLRISTSILASFFTFLYLRNLKLFGKTRGLSNLSSFFGALVFGFSPFILVWGDEVINLSHSVIWLPLALFSIEKFLEKNDKNFLALLSMSCTLSILGGFVQATIYLYIFVLAYIIFRTGFKKTRLLKKGLGLFAALIFGISISAIQLLPSAELFFNSARADVSLREALFGFLLPIPQLMTYLAPDFFGHPATRNFFLPGSSHYYEGILFVGIAALIFAAFAVFSKTKDKLVPFLAILGLIFLSGAFDLPTSRLFISLPVPFLSSSIANRILFIPAFCLAILSAIGFEKWMEAKDKKILRVIFALAVIYGLIIVLLLAVKFFKLPYFENNGFKSAANVVVSLRNLIIPFGVFAVSSVLIIFTSYRTKFKKIAGVLIISVAFLHMFYFAQKYFSFTDRKNVFPENPVLTFILKNQDYYRSWGVGKATLENNFANQYGIFWPEGYDSLNNLSYAQFTYSMQNGKFSDFIFRADAGLGRGGAKELLTNPFRRELVDMVGVKYVMASEEDFAFMEKNNFKKVFDPPQGTKIGVFENLEVMPRAFLASNYEGPPQVDSTGKTDEQIKEERRKLIISKLTSSSFDWRNSLILEEPSPISPQFGPGNAEILKYKPEEVVVKTESSQPKLLFLSDNFYPGWKAKVDGDETPILRANYTFRAVPLTPGEHLVRFYYDSEVFKVGAAITILSLIFLGFFTLKKSRLVG